MSTARDRPPEEAAEDTSFARGLRVLLTIADRGEIRVDELSGLLETPVSTIYRYLRTLTEFGFVDRTASGYRLGPRLVIGRGTNVSSEELICVADPVLQSLATETGETAVITRRIGLAAVCLHEAQSPQPLRVNLAPGTSIPLHRGAFAKVLLGVCAAGHPRGVPCPGTEGTRWPRTERAEEGACGDRRSRSRPERRRVHRWDRDHRRSHHSRGRDRRGDRRYRPGRALRVRVARTHRANPAWGGGRDRWLARCRCAASLAPTTPYSGTGTSRHLTIRPNSICSASRWKRSMRSSRRVTNTPRSRSPKRSTGTSSPRSCGLSTSGISSCFARCVGRGPTRSASRHSTTLPMPRRQRQRVRPLLQGTDVIGRQLSFLLPLGQSLRRPGGIGASCAPSGGPPHRGDVRAIHPRIRARVTRRGDRSRSGVRALRRPGRNGLTSPPSPTESQTVGPDDFRGSPVPAGAPVTCGPADPDPGRPGPRQRSAPTPRDGRATHRAGHRPRLRRST